MKSTEIPHPVLKWAGGKSALIPLFEKMHLIPNDFNDYYEPFFGAGAVFFHLWNKGLVEKAVVSDINPDLYNVYELVKRHCDKLISFSESMNLGVDSVTYYSNRSRFNELKKNKKLQRSLDLRLERAVLMIYLNKTCYSGMYRENRDGLFNVPCGYYKNPTIIDVDNLYAVSDSLKKVTIKCNDFNKIIPELPKENDFVYLDPPYMPYGEVSTFRDYHRSGFNNDRQEELCHAFIKMTDNKVKLLLSNSSNPELNEMYLGKKKDLSIITVPAQRLINQKRVGRITVDEYVILNYKTEQNY